MTISKLLTTSVLLFLAGCGGGGGGDSSNDGGSAKAASLEPYVGLWLLTDDDFSLLDLVGVEQLYLHLDSNGVLEGYGYEPANDCYRTLPSGIVITGTTNNTYIAEHLSSGQSMTGTITVDDEENLTLTKLGTKKSIELYATEFSLTDLTLCNEETAAKDSAMLLLEDVILDDVLLD